MEIALPLPLVKEKEKVKRKKRPPPSETMTFCYAVMLAEFVGRIAITLIGSIAFYQGWRMGHVVLVSLLLVTVSRFSLIPGDDIMGDWDTEKGVFSTAVGQIFVISNLCLVLAVAISVHMRQSVHWTESFSAEACLRCVFDTEWLLFTAIVLYVVQMRRKSYISERVMRWALGYLIFSKIIDLLIS